MSPIDRLVTRWTRAETTPLVAGLLLCLASPTVAAQSAGDQWYIGIGGGGSLLSPDTEADIDANDEANAAATLILGRDLDSRSSVQLQLHGLGEVDFDNNDGAQDGESATYNAADLSVMYRFFDSRDFRSRGSLGVSFFGRFGLGYMNRDSDLELEPIEDVWFGAGAGVEVYLTRNIGLRAEGLFLDTDAAVGYVSLIGRFGGQLRRPPTPTAPAAPTAPSTSTPSTPTTPAAPTVPSTATAPVAPTAPSAPTTPATPTAPTAPQAPRTPEAPTRPTPTPSPADSDGDGVGNADDVCPQSSIGFPVQDNGCALLDGVLTGVRFVDGTAELQSGSSAQLDYLADVLSEYPGARIELHSHSDNRGSDRDQAVLTRGRLRTVGTYLVSRGVSANRLVLRSFGGSQPLYDNNTAQGRADNNRIEVIENTR